MSEPTTVPTSSEAWRRSKEFLCLTTKQRRWIEVFLQTQDTGIATSAAYGSDTSERYRRMLSDKVAGSPNVRAVIDLIYGRSVKDRMVADLMRDVSRSKGMAKIEAQKLLARLTGIVVPDGEATSEPTFALGTIVEQDGRRYKIVAQEL